MVLKLGYDCFSFNLSHQELPSTKGPLPDFGPDRVELWANELRLSLDQLAGDKIIYSFSFPSNAVPALLSRGSHSDVKAWICDGGPFLDMFMCQWNLFTYGFPVPNPLKRFTLTLLSYLVMRGPLFASQVTRWLGAMDTNLPILSLRGDVDRVVPMKSIAKYFATNPDLNLTSIALKDVGHLDGLKHAPEFYKAQIVRFLQDHKL